MSADKRPPPLLIVDDDEDALALLEMALTRRGFAVVTATSYAAAEEVIAGQAIVGVVTDIDLGDGDGRALAARAAGKPLVVLTGAAPEDGQPWPQLQKPVDLAALLTTLGAAGISPLPTSENRA